MISASNIFNDLATALRRTMSPVRKKDANAAATAAATAADENPSEEGATSSQSVTMVASGDVECVAAGNLKQSSPASGDCKAKNTAKKRARFEPLPPLLPAAAAAATADAPMTLSDSDRRSKSLRQRRRQSLAVGMESGNREVVRTSSGGRTPEDARTHKRSRAAQYKRRQSMAASTVAAAAAAASTSPHFHPDLTLEKLREMQTSAQQKKQASMEASLTPMQSLDFNDAQFLEINTMFDFHPMPGVASPSPKSAVTAPETTTSKERPSRPRLRSGGDEQEDKADQNSKVRQLVECRDKDKPTC